MLSKGYKIALIIKENSSGSLLVISIITWVEHFNSWFLTWFHQSWSNTISKSNVEPITNTYPEAPVPKSIAIT
jgi:hypothetical protein